MPADVCRTRRTAVLFWFRYVVLCAVTWTAQCASKACDCRCDVVTKPTSECLDADPSNRHLPARCNSTGVLREVADVIDNPCGCLCDRHIASLVAAASTKPCTGECVATCDYELDTTAGCRTVTVGCEPAAELHTRRIARSSSLSCPPGPIYKLHCPYYPFSCPQPFGFPAFVSDRDGTVALAWLPDSVLMEVRTSPGLRLGINRYVVPTAFDGAMAANASLFFTFSRPVIVSDLRLVLHDGGDLFNFSATVNNAATWVILDNFNFFSNYQMPLASTFEVRPMKPTLGYGFAALKVLTPPAPGPLTTVFASTVATTSLPPTTSASTTATTVLLIGAPEEEDATSAPINVGAIVGAVVGIAVVIAIVLALLAAFRVRLRHLLYKQDTSPTQPQESGVVYQVQQPIASAPPIDA
jgi:hypothetical protein